MKEQARIRTGMAQTRQHQGGPLSLISCVSGRETSPLSENDPRETSEMKTETKKKRFHPLRGLRRMFRRKARRSGISEESYKIGTVESESGAPGTGSEQRSRSAGRLLREETSEIGRRSTGLAPGLSLSHDSVFAPDRGDSGHSSSDLENSSLSIPVSVPAPRFQAELADAVRRRNRGESEDEEEEDEDLGLPRSPCSSLTTADVLRDKSQEPVGKSQSSCSEASLLSMESSDADGDPGEPKSELDLSVASKKLSHSAAKHKMAVRPKRNHGAPRGKRRIGTSVTALPATPEANEEPGLKSGGATAEDKNDDARVSASFPPVNFSSRDSGKKSASLPHGAALSSSPKIVRSRSSATSARFRKRVSSDEETEDENGETKEGRETKREESFLGRLLPRRSGKKKKAESDSNRETTAGKEELGEESPEKKPIAGTRNPEKRQRMEPADVPSDPPFPKKEDCARFGRSVSEGSNRMKISYSASPPKTRRPDRVLSRSVSPPEAIWPKEMEGDEWTDLRINRYESNWEESRKAVDGRFFKKEIPGGNFCRRDFSPSKIRGSAPPRSEPTETETDADARVRKSRSFGNFSVGVYGEERKRKESDSDGVRGEEQDSAKRLYVKNASAMKSKSSRKEEKPAVPVPLPRKSASLESVGSSDVAVVEKISVKSVSSESFGPGFPGRGVAVSYEEPRYANLKKFPPDPNRYDKVDHGYENVRIIELVKKEIADSEVPSVPVSSEPDKKCPSKPPVSEKPKEPKKDSSTEVPEFMRVQLNRVESRNSVSPAASKGGTRKEPTERRKSEPSPAVEEPDVKNLISKMKSGKKQGGSAEEPKNKNLSETGVSKHVLVQKAQPENVPATEKTETADSEEVVLRKKPSVPSDKDDQPELMKVFARRSLKIKEDEDLAEDARKSRDSDKENDNSESLKEERKKVQPSAERPAPATVKTKIFQEPSAVKSSFFHRYGRSTSENGTTRRTETEKGIPDRRTAPLVPDKENLVSAESLKRQERVKAWEGVPCDKVLDVPDVAPEGTESAQESGFKRIQERKAEWERRMQQAAKR